MQGNKFIFHIFKDKKMCGISIASVTGFFLKVYMRYYRVIELMLVNIVKMHLF